MHCRSLLVSCAPCSVVTVRWYWRTSSYGSNSPWCCAHIHVHGYDLVAGVGPGLPPARIRFRATTPGRFEVELEDRRLQIAQLEVRP